MHFVSGSKILVFGGFNHGLPQKNIYRFDIGRNTWQLLRPKGHGESPGATASALQVPLAGFCSAIHGTKMIVIGGNGSGSGPQAGGILQIDQVFDEGVDPMLSSFVFEKKKVGLMTDVVFHVHHADGDVSTIQGHRCILGPRSPYLDALFQQQQQQSDISSAKGGEALSRNAEGSLGNSTQVTSRPLPSSGPSSTNNSSNNNQAPLASPSAAATATTATTATETTTIDEIDIEALQRQLDAQLSVSEEDSSEAAAEEGEGEEGERGGKAAASKIQHIHIGDYSHQVLNAFIEFLYTGKLELKGRENLESLCKLAQEWGTHSDVIKRICLMDSVNLSLSAAIQVCQAN